jgi:hypothetical protein
VYDFDVRKTNHPKRMAMKQQIYLFFALSSITLSAMDDDDNVRMHETGWFTQRTARRVINGITSFSAVTLLHTSPSFATELGGIGIVTPLMLEFNFYPWRRFFSQSKCFNNIERATDIEEERIIIEEKMATYRAACIRRFLCCPMFACCKPQDKEEISLDNIKMKKE